MPEKYGLKSKTRLKKICLFSLLCMVLTLVSGCVSTTFIYSPSSSLTATGSVMVSDFKYLPSINGKIDPKSIYTTSYFNIDLDKRVDVSYKDAVFKELRSVGIKTNSKDRILTGDIQEFFVDPVGFGDAQWTLRVTYYVRNMHTSELVYQGEKVERRSINKLFDDVYIAPLADIIRANIDKLIEDKTFLEAIN